MAKDFPQIACFCFFLFTLTIAIAQETSSPEKDLAAKLIAANTDEDRARLLEINKSLLNVELRKALIVEGDKLRVQSDFPKALDVFNLTQQIAEQIGDKAGIGHSIRAIGTIYAAQGNEILALDFFQQSLAIAEQINDKALVASSLRSIGVVEENRGNVDKALENFQKSLVIAEELKDKTQIAAILNNFGVLHADQGNFRVAIDYLEKALNLRYELGNKELIASSLNNIAILHDFQGNYAQALEYYRKSLKLREELGDKANIANVMNNMGDYRLLGDYELALQYNKKSLAIAEELGDKRLIARALGNIGNKYRQMGQYDRALEFFQRSFALAEELDYKENMANHLRNLANIYYEKGDYDESLIYAERALTIARQIGSRKDLWTGLETRGRAYRALKQTEKARQDFEEAIATIENWRYLVAGGELEQQSLFAEKVSPYHEMIGLLVSQNLTEEALDHAERAKARVLLDVLSSGRTNIYKTMTPQERQQEEDWKQQLGSLNKQIQEEKSNPQADPKLMAKLDTQLQSTRLSFESFRAELYTVHPELRAQRGESRIVQQQEIADLLDEQSAILEYVVSEEKIFVFILTRNSSSSPLSSTTQVVDIKEIDLAKRIEDFRKRIADRDARFRQPSVELYDLLLRPMAKELDGKTKLIIIPDGALWELPFQALSSGDGYLLDDYSVCYAPSITVLHEMKKLHREKSKPENPRLFALGNPTLSKEIKHQVNLVYRGEVLEPLPEAETEVMGLSKLYGSNASKVYVGAMASEELIKQETENFNVLHIATHAVIDNAAPMYSQVVLASGKESQEDGLLEAWEIMNLTLKADLVVLSACETALGEVRQGEGMLGLTWAFFVTGSSAEVVSQWKVASASTTNLMLAFHRNLKANMSKAEALRQAELELSRNRLYRHPFYWAPFVLIGDGS